MSTGVLEGLMCFLITFSCLATCCGTGRDFSCQGDYNYNVNTNQDIRDVQQRDVQQPANNPISINININNSREENDISSRNYDSPNYETFNLLSDNFPQEDTSSEEDTQNQVCDLPLKKNNLDFFLNYPILVSRDIIEKDIECSICLEKYLINEKLHLLECGHYFHFKCYGKWIKQKSKSTIERCPLCQNITGSKIFDSKKSVHIL